MHLTINKIVKTGDEIMSVVVLAWCPEGIAVASDSRGTNIDEDTLYSDDVKKIIYFEEHRMLVTLCGYSHFGNEQFEQFVQTAVNEHFKRNNSLPTFVNELLRKILINDDCTQYLYQIIVAGYDSNDNEVISVIMKGENNDTIDSDWFINELNGCKNTDCQYVLFPVMKDHLYGTYVAGEDIYGRSKLFNVKDFNVKKRLDMHYAFESMTLIDAVNYCKNQVVETKEHLEAIKEYSTVGGDVKSCSINNPVNCCGISPADFH